MFNDIDFEGGSEFTSDFCSNIYSRLYLPDSDIVATGENFYELIMIQEGIVVVTTKVINDKGEASVHEYFVLPTYSYVGDY